MNTVLNKYSSEPEPKPEPQPEPEPEPMVEPEAVQREHEVQPIVRQEGEVEMAKSKEERSTTVATTHQPTHAQDKHFDKVSTTNLLESSDQFWWY